MRAYALALAAFTLSAMMLAADQRGSTSLTTPRRDLSGIWLGAPAPTLEPFAPMTPKGQALFDEARPIWGPRAVAVAESNDPLVTCDPLGMPRAVLNETRGIQFIPGPDKIVQLLQYQRVFREIWTDGRPLPADVGGASPQSPDPRRYGYSIGRWVDDDTFVVETTGATETMWGDQYGHPHGLTGRIEERYRRVGAGLELVVTIDDPEMYQQPFVAMRQRLKRGTTMDEQLCVPSEALTYLETIAKPAVRGK